MLKKFVKDLGKYSLSQFLPAITAFITTPILTRLFPPTEYGLWALALSVSAFLVAITASGFGSAVIRYYPIYKTRSKLNVFFASLGISFSFIILIVAGICLIIIYLFKDLFFLEFSNLIPIVVLIFILQSIYTVFLAVIRAQERSGTYTIFELLLKYGGLLVGILLVIGFGFRVDGLLWGTFLILALILPFLVFLTTRKTGFHLSQFQFKDAFQIANYAWPLSLGNVAMWGLRLSDLFIISHFLSESDVGLYSVSYNISSKSIELLVMLFLLSVSPRIMNTWETEGQNATENSLTTVTRIYLVLCLPAVVGLSILAYPFVALLTTPEYFEGYKIVGFVALSSFMWGLANIAQTGLTIKLQARRLAINQIYAAAIHIGLALLLVPRFGYQAAAVTTLIGYTLLLILNTLDSKRYITWRFPISSLLNVLFGSIVMGMVALGIYNIPGKVGGVSLIHLFLSVVMAVMTYVICLWILGEVTQDEKKNILQILYRVTAKGI